MAVTWQDTEAFAEALYAAYASQGAGGPVAPLGEQTPAEQGKWQIVADGVLTLLAPERRVVDAAVKWREVTKRLSHAPEAPERVAAEEALRDAVDASGR